jgi:hypothetical protein
METTVVNIKTDAFDVYIGRAGHGYDGYFGNPIRFGHKCCVCGQVHVDNGQGRDDLLACYKQWLWRRLNTDDEFRARVAGLQGKKLGCFCKPKKCHGDVIKAWLDAGCPLRK